MRFREKNDDRRNPAGGIATGTRTVRKGGWLQFGGDHFYSPELEKFAGSRVWVNDLEDAFSPITASCILPNGLSLTIRNLYHMRLKGEFPAHLRTLEPRMR